MSWSINFASSTKGTAIVCADGHTSKKECDAAKRETEKKADKVYQKTQESAKESSKESAKETKEEPAKSNGWW